MRKRAFGARIRSADLTASIAGRVVILDVVPVEHPVTVPLAKGKTSLAGVLKGLSARASVADLTPFCRRSRA